MHAGIRPDKRALLIVVDDASTRPFEEGAIVFSIMGQLEGGSRRDFTLQVSIFANNPLD
jgi:hypothetical protein